MGIYKVKDRRGRRRYVVRKYWPHGSGRLRMYAPNYRSAQALQTRIESSILDGTWKQLKGELARGKRTIWTVHSFYQRFLVDRRGQNADPTAPPRLARTVTSTDLQYGRMESRLERGMQ